MYRTGSMIAPSGGSNSLTDKLSEYKWTILGFIAVIAIIIILYYYCRCYYYDVKTKCKQGTYNNCT